MCLHVHVLNSNKNKIINFPWYSYIVNWFLLLQKTEIVEDMRARQKEQLLQVAHRVQSEYSFHCAALGTAQQEDVTGLATTEE